MDLKKKVEKLEKENEELKKKNLEFKIPKIRKRKRYNKKQ